MTILGIESSCDETSAAVIDSDSILSNIITTQKIHEEYGGVVPEFASRAHVKLLVPIIKKALTEAGKSLNDIDGLAVTYGPGLAGSLLVGLGVCKGLALGLDKKWIGVNHIEGHLSAAFLENDISYPFICLIISGGHTQLVLVKKPLDYKIIGRTIDDAAGEAFDKVAKILRLGYPGGPVIEMTALDGNPDSIQFPRALLDKDNLDFSFSGLKTAVLYHVQSQTLDNINIADVAASFQKAVIDVLLIKSIKALQKYKCQNLVIAGGVACNSALRKTFEEKCHKKNISLFIPSPKLCTDNAAMIAKAGQLRLLKGQQSDLDLDVVPNLSLVN